MRLEGDAGQYLELDVVGYEFPNLHSSGPVLDFDANWLLIAGQASDGKRAWSFREPCLLTTDVRRLAAWLDALADGRPDEEAIDFLEPELEFRRVSPPGAQPVVRAIFSLGARPPWAPDLAEDDWDGNRLDLFTYLDFDGQRDAIRVAAAALRTELERFPER